MPFRESSTVLYRCRDVRFTSDEIDLIVAMGRHRIALLRHVQVAGPAEHNLCMGSCRSEPEGLEVAMDGVLPLLVADAASVIVITDGVARFAAHRGLNGDLSSWSSPAGQLTAASVIRTKQTLRRNDIRDGRPERRRWPIRAAVLAPVEVDGVVVALLAAYRYTTRSFQAEDEYALTTLASQVAAAMVNMQLVMSSAAARQTAEFLRDLYAALNARLSAA